MSVRVACVALVAIAAACQPAAETPEQAAMRMEEESAAAMTAISARTQAFARHFSAASWDSAVTYYTADALVMAPNVPTMAGRDAVLAGFNGLGQTGSFALTLRTQGVAANGPMAVEHGRWVMTFTPAATAPRGVTAMTDSGKFLAHWRQSDGVWRMAQDIWNSDTPLPPPPAPRRN